MAGSIRAQIAINQIMADTNKPRTYRKVVESKIPWRGSLSDLVTDIAYLLTPAEGEQLVSEINRYLNSPHLANKWQGRGYVEVKDESRDA